MRLSQVAHESASAVNASLTLASIIFFVNFSPQVRGALFRLDVSLNRFFGLASLSSRDYSPGYFSFFVPVLGIAVLIWVILRLFADRRPARWFLRSAAGVLSPLAAPILMLAFLYSIGRWRPIETPFELLEALAVLAAGLWYELGARRIASRTVISVLAVHYAFWTWHYWPLFFPLGLLIPLAGLCGSLTWFLHVTSRPAFPNG